MTKPNFENTISTDMFDNFMTIDEKIEEEKAIATNEEAKNETNEEVKKTDSKKEDIDKTKSDKKSIKKAQIYSEVDSVVCDYLNLKTIVTGQSKKDILNEIFEKEIKATFQLSENASLDEMQKAIDKKMKQIESMKNLFK